MKNKNNKKRSGSNTNIAKKFAVQTGKLSAMILKILLITGFITIDQMFSPSLYRNYEINYKELWNEPLFDFGNKTKTPQKIFKRSSIYAALYRLQKQGLVSNSKSNWLLTQKGTGFVESFFKLRSKYSKQPLPEEDGAIRIVIFDIPEKAREKRDWIRGELVYHDYKPLQKSAWIGYRPLLPEFIKNIDFLGLSENVHIFSVKNEGTIMKSEKFKLRN